MLVVGIQDNVKRSTFPCKHKSLSHIRKELFMDADKVFMQTIKELSEALALEKLKSNAFLLELNQLKAEKEAEKESDEKGEDDE